MRVVLMAYTPDALKRAPRDLLIAELAATFSDLEVFSFNRVGTAHSAGGVDRERRIAQTRQQLNAEALEKAARAAIDALLNVVEVRQR